MFADLDYEYLERNRDIFAYDNNFFEFHIEPSYLSIRQDNNEREKINLKELKSHNNSFILEKNMKYSLYLLYINWKKIETKKLNNNDNNIFKLFGYFGAVKYNILKEIDENCGDKYNHKNFLFSI